MSWVDRFTGSVYEVIVVLLGLTIIYYIGKKLIVIIIERLFPVNTENSKIGKMMLDDAISQDRYNKERSKSKDLEGRGSFADKIA